MGVLCDSQIREEVKIVPWSEPVSGGGVISYGVSSYGYDLRLGRKYKQLLPSRHDTQTLDPKDHREHYWLDLEGDQCIVPPNSLVLAETLEWLEIPRDTIAICVGKSTYARIGIIANVTPLEPGWRGKVTIELSNTTPLPAKVYSGEGIVQVLFLRADRECETSYADKRGKYQDQSGLVHSIVR